MRNEPDVKVPQVLTILWLAMFSSTVMFLGVAWFLSQQEGRPKLPAQFLIVFGGAAFVMAVVAAVLPQWIYVSNLKGRNFDVVDGTEAGPSRYRLASSSTRNRSRSFKDPEGAIGVARVLYQTKMILGLALSESVAIFGLTLVILGLPPLNGLPFWIVSWGLMVFHRPKPSGITVPLEEAYDANLVAITEPAANF